MQSVEPGPALAAERIVESAVELARAEAVLALARSRVLVAPLIVVLLAPMLTAAAAQVALMMIALAPMLLEEGGWSAIVFALAPAVSLTLLGASVTWAAWQKLRKAAGLSSVRGEA